MPETTLAAIISYIFMLIAFYKPQHHRFHVGTMSVIMIFDLLMPFYLYLNRDWKERLIDGGEIFSFLIWMHVGLLLTLYALYVLQILAGRKLLKGEQETRDTHAGQAKGILLVRALVIITGAILYEPEP
jgi:hypothetical protein